MGVCALLLCLIQAGYCRCLVIDSSNPPVFPRPRCQENPYREIRIFIEKSERYDFGGFQGLIRQKSIIFNIIPKT